MSDQLPTVHSDIEPGGGDLPPFEETLAEAMAIARERTLELEVFGWALGAAVAIARRHPSLSPAQVIHLAIGEALAEWDL